MKTLILTKGPQIRRVILLATLIGVPVMYWRAFNDPFNTIKLGILLLGVALAASIRLIELTQGAKSDGLRRLILPFVFIAAPMTLAWLFATYKEWSLFGEFGRFQGLIPYIAVAMFGLLVADAFDRGNVRLVAWAFAAIGAAVGGYAIVQALGLDPFQWNLQGTESHASISTLGNPNFAGGILAICLPFLLGLWAAEPDRRATLWKIALVTVGGLVLTFSQGGWVAAAAGIAVVAALFLQDRVGRARALSIGLVALMAAAIVGSTIYAVASSDVIGPLQTAQYRGWWWESAVRMAGDSLVLGHGPNAFAVEGIHYRPVEDAALFGFVFADDPHSVPLALLAAGGLLLLAGFIAVFVWAARLFLKNASVSPLTHAFAGAIFAYLVQAVVSIDEVSLRTALWASLGGLMASTIEPPTVAKKRTRKGKRADPRSPSGQRLRWPLAVGGIVIAGALAAWWVGGFLLADARVRQGHVLFDEGRPEEGAMEFRKALAFRDEYHYRKELGLELGLAAIRGKDPALAEQMHQTFSYLDYFPDAGALASEARQLNDMEEERLTERAAEVFKEAVRLDPHNPLLALEAADTMIEASQFESAIETVENVLVKPGNRYAQLWGAYALALAQDGQTEEAEEAAELALASNAGEPRASAAKSIIDSEG